MTDHERYVQQVIRERERQYADKIATVLWAVMIATIGLVALTVICIAASSFADASKMKGKAPRYYPTPVGTSCADVRQKQQQYGFTSVAQAKAYAAANGILVTPTQERQILSCLRGHG